MLGAFCKFINCTVHFVNSQQFRARARVRVAARVRVRDRVNTV